MLKFDVPNRFHGKAQFTAEIDATDDTLHSVKVRLAVQWAIKARADLSGADLSGADLFLAHLSGADLSRTILSGADLSGADLSGADLSRTDLSGADFSGADLSRTDLSGADLSGADFSRADLSGADLSGADLSRTDLSGANLLLTYFSGADLSRTILSRSNLSSTDLVDGGQRADGYRFVGWVKDGVLCIRAGCQNFTISEARKYWHADRCSDKRLGAESRLILDRIEKTAELRGLVKTSVSCDLCEGSGVVPPDPIDLAWEDPRDCPNGCARPSVQARGTREMTDADNAKAMRAND